MALLTLDRVTKRFGGLLANNNVSFDVVEGEILGLIGPNGAGKSTLFEQINGFYPPTNGRIEFQGGLVGSLCRRPISLVEFGFAKADESSNISGILARHFLE